MFIRKLGLTVAGAVTSLVLLSCFAFGAEFSATMVSTGGPMPATGKVYVKGQNIRQETSAGKRTSISIINASKKLFIMVDPATKSYLAEPIPANKVTQASDEMRGKLPANPAAHGVKVKKLGTETVNGYTCTKLLLEKQGTKATMWYSKKLEMPIRMVATQLVGGKPASARQELKNIKEGNVPSSLFDIPKGYKKITPQGGPAPSPGRAPAGRGRTR